MNPPSTPIKDNGRAAVCVSPELSAKLLIGDDRTIRAVPEISSIKERSKSSQDVETTKSGRPLRKCRLRVPTPIQSSFKDPSCSSDSRKRSFNTILNPSTSERGVLSPRRKSIVPVVPYDEDEENDDAQVSSDAIGSKDRIGKRSKRANHSPKPKPLPLKLTQSQIHSKRYPFPNKLFDLLETATLENSEVVSWSPDGTTFVVHDHARFEAEFLPSFFGHHQFRSFDRQLNFWHFETISPKTINNTSFGGKSWKHPFFQRDRRDLLPRVIRKSIPARSSKKKSKKQTRKPIKASPVSKPPPPPPRVVSPTGSPVLKSGRKSSLDTIMAALDIVTDMARSEDSILEEPLIVSEWLQDEKEQESFDSILLEEVFIPPKNNDVPWDDNSIFEGKTFHEVDDEEDAQLFLDMLQDKEEDNLLSIVASIDLDNQGVAV